MEILKNYESIKNTINNNPLTLLFAKSNGCGVCDVLLPKVEGRIKEHDVPGAVVFIDDVPEFSGQFTVYTVPTIIIFVSGKEVYRQSRFLQIDDIDRELEKWKTVIS